MLFKKRISTWLAPALLVASQNSAAVIVQFDYTYDSNGFFNDTTAKSLLESAGSFFSTVITDDLTAIDSQGINHFNAVFNNPGDGSNTTINDFDVAADTLTIFAGARALSGSTLAVAGPGGFSVSGTQSFLDNAVTRGETGDTQGATAVDFAPWGGTMSFDTSASWYFDSDPFTTENFTGNDFFSVALHELGHVLGLGTADSWDNLVSGNVFTGASSQSVFGNNVPLHGDAAHWAEGTISLVNGNSQEAAMDPSIVNGTRKVFTDLDLAALQDVGWEVNVSAIPLPPALYLFIGGLIGLFSLRKKAAPPR